MFILNLSKILLLQKRHVMKKLYIETYGCQMNFSDSEIVGSIMQGDGCMLTDKIDDANIILINTCSIRENAENRIFNRLRELEFLKRKNNSVIGIIGCMAERMKEDLLEKEPVVDLIAGPDAYRDLPRLIEEISPGRKAVQTQLSVDETYADIKPVRIDSNGVTAFISIMRGCENYCSYCVVPYTRGKERSRNPETIVAEARNLFNNGFREVTLLGQNVNSYRWISHCIDDQEVVFSFSDLMAAVAEINPLLRVRFATSHPKDLSDELINIIAKYDNICKYIHLPLQSGSTSMLERMNRKYTREWYLDRVNAIKSAIPNCSIGTDIIAGFSGETEDEHHDTLSIMREVGYDYAYMFKYSERPGTLASRHFPDDIPDEVKGQRLNEIIDLQQQLSFESNKRDISKTFEVLVEGKSKRSDAELYGRNSQNKVIIFPAGNIRPGEYVNVKVNDCTAATLIGTVVQ